MRTLVRHVGRGRCPNHSNLRTGGLRMKDRYTAFDWTPELIERFKRLWEIGIKGKPLAEEIGCSHAQLLRARKKFGLPARTVFLGPKGKGAHKTAAKAIPVTVHAHPC